MKLSTRSRTTTPRSPSFRSVRPSTAPKVSDHFSGPVGPRCSSSGSGSFSGTAGGPSRGRIDRSPSLIARKAITNPTVAVALPTIRRSRSTIVIVPRAYLVQFTHFDCRRLRRWALRLGLADARFTHTGGFPRLTREAVLMDLLRSLLLVPALDGAL